MWGLGPATKVYVALGATDLRKGFDGLYGLARDALGLEPLSGHLALFCNRQRTRLKVLFWDGSGLWLCTKTHVAHCAHWEVCKDPLPLLSPFRTRVRSVRCRRRRARSHLCPAPQPHHARGAGLDV
jgi:transposase